jgi:hypothetical protein
VDIDTETELSCDELDRPDGENIKGNLLENLKNIYTELYMIDIVKDTLNVAIHNMYTPYILTQYRAKKPGGSKFPTEDTI